MKYLPHAIAASAIAICFTIIVCTGHAKELEPIGCLIVFLLIILFA